MIKLNNHTIKPTIFPDKTSQVWKLSQSSLHLTINIIDWVFESESEFMHVAQLVYRIKNDPYFKEVPLSLHIPYLPYARQDKGIDDCFAGFVFMDLLASLKVDRITCNDVHSTKLLEYGRDEKKLNIASYYVAMPYEKMKELEILAICFGDSSAYEKYKDAYTPYNINMGHLTKERDAKTGRVTVDEVWFEHKFVDRTNVLFIDDICDGGSTFIQGTKEIAYTAGQPVRFFLYVTHGIFSKGIDVLKESAIERIFTSKGEIT